ncbi:ATP-dependent DNA helicase RecG [Anaerococcus sp. NML200574]|uniref:ATP-dependent DNA helicase RecG n=1 Tax=Anaerococcus sp. NML200574 TaxID=2954486 RepID=UPI0022372C72|nr:ATP-dependent DNA helicase RecG [Anaerococcus sp. NML200574]MCW6677829.1 ATP-dependent DNA helicase RecG [Anaerococcus sp. NML200574]
MNKELTDLRGIGPKKAKTLNKLDIYTVSDLYNFYPRAYEDRSKKILASQARGDRAYFFVWKSVSKPYFKKLKNVSLSYMYFEDELGNKIRVVWFNDRFSIRSIELNKKYKFYTKVSLKKGFYEAINPIFEGLGGNEIGGIYSIYPLTSGLSQKNIRAFIKEALSFYNQDEELLNQANRDQCNLLSRQEALNIVHFPDNVNDLLRAKSDIKILDLLKELIFLYHIGKNAKIKQDINLSYKLDNILGRLDFALTKPQLRSLNEILSDCSGKYAMNRLLVGDVGSGKTIVGIIAMIVFGLSSYQSAMMVPTEVLAIQQYEKYKDLIESFSLNVALLTGSSKDKDEIKAKLLNGDIDIVIGTHALIQADLLFNDLRLVINDEQHRFGVKQRQALAKKGQAVNYLTMTATPIPRTLSLKINQMLDLSVINELPMGREIIDTHIIVQDREKILFEQISKNLEDGRQIYVVSNNIDSDDDNSVENLYKRYKKQFKSYRVEILHGKLNSEIKESILSDFSSGIINILISTTVIEVGIDVANANIIVIYNANNFGLSQLHQLRGRVGRGQYKSYCYLVNKNADANLKLNILEKTNDGFEIAQKDYELRGGGKILSLIQHGKNLSEIEYLNMTQEETDRSFEIFDYLKSIDFKGVNIDFIKKFFDEDKDIILN